MSRRRRRSVLVWGLLLALSGLALNLAQQPRSVQEAQVLWTEGRHG